MPRLLHFLTAFLFPTLLAGQIVVNGNFDGVHAVARHAEFFEDRMDSVRIENLVANPEKYPFENIKNEDQNVGFSASVFWVKLVVKTDEKSAQEVYLEVARPITNTVGLYYTDGAEIRKTEIGDDFPFGQKIVHHRANVFRLLIPTGVERIYYLKLKSDGEVLYLGLNLYSPETFTQVNYGSQLFYGFFYGILLLIVVTNLFFYFTFRERIYGYYVLYVISIGMLQFALDGFMFQYIFPENPYAANLSVLLFAALSLLFISVYTRKFLDIPRTLPSFSFPYKLVIIFSVISAIASFFPGVVAQSGYVLVNFTSLIGIGLIFTSVIVLIKRRIEISNYFVLAIGTLTAGTTIFILTNMNVLENTFWTYNSLKLGNGIEVVLLSFSIATRYRKIQNEKELAQNEVLRNLQELNQMKDEATNRLEKEVGLRTAELKMQKEIVESKNRDITNSLNYARTLQTAVYPSEVILEQAVDDHFVFHIPKDIVSGDFYWFAMQDDFLFAAVADCTGHGVPGAIMSMIGIESLNQIVKHNQISDVGLILEQLDEYVKNALSQSEDNLFTEHGMDIAILKIDLKTRELQFAGANRPLFSVPGIRGNDGITKDIKATKRGIGGHTNADIPFEVKAGNIPLNSWIYLFTDGYADQFGGAQGKKLMRKRLYNFLENGSENSGSEQKKLLLNYFNQWKGTEDQVDDVCIMGIRI